MSDIKFIVDINVGKLSHWLRMMGYDTLLFNGPDDGEMLKTALQQNRVILTRDSQFLKRRLITNKTASALFVSGETPQKQLKYVAETLNLNYTHRPFTICLECNSPLINKNRDEVKEKIPPYVYKNHDSFMECPSCHRVYWQGTHWEAMIKELKGFAGEKDILKVDN
jgi:uncharacterized protein with PIN domain